MTGGDALGSLPYATDVFHVISFFLPSLALYAPRAFALRLVRSLEWLVLVVRIYALSRVVRVRCIRGGDGWRF